MASPADPRSHPFHEPPLGTLLPHAAFLLLLNLLPALHPSLSSSGLILQLLLGTIFGTPLAQWLPSTSETTITTLGYIGLILLVYSGGLSTSLRPLVKNLILSSCAALTGIGVPIALSFTLCGYAGATKLQAFAAGAGMAATSLGTTFEILKSAGLEKTRLGVVLTSAAMLDDVVGLVMIQVVSGLGKDGGKISVESVVRPVAASFGLVAAIVGIAWVTRKVFGGRKWGGGWEKRWVCQTAVLFGAVAAAGYAGASVLFAAFLAGAAVSWWDDSREAEQEGVRESGRQHRITGVEVYEQVYGPVAEKLLIPLFFASIGFAIPIKDMFAGSTVWKGFVYTALMFLAKFSTAIWLLRFSVPGMGRLKSAASKTGTKLRAFRKLGHPSTTSKQALTPTPQQVPACFAEKSEETSNTETPPPQREPSLSHKERPVQERTVPSKIPTPPRSLYPPAIMGMAMVARGEVAFLIASVADSQGIFGESEIYMIVMWAALLCTVIGPIAVGIMVTRVKALEKESAERRGAEGRGGRDDVLGIWGDFTKHEET